MPKTIQSRNGFGSFNMTFCIIQFHPTGQRHSFHFSAIGNEPEAKGLPSEG